MIVVVGEPRTGTSLMMLILKNLGLGIVGDFATAKTPKEFNPTGMWEIPKVPYNGIRSLLPEKHHDLIDGDAMKLMTRGFLRSNKGLFDKMILCIRDPRESIVSQRKQAGYEGLEDDQKNLAMWLCLNHLLMKMFSPGITQHMLVVDYGDMMFDPKKEIQRICDFLDLEITQAAIDSIRPDLYRSKKHKIKRCKLMKKAEKYYQALRLLIK